MIELEIKGMTCGHCKAAVENALTSVTGVSDVVVQLEAGKASVTGGADLNALIAAVIAEGYEARVAA
jgi:copper chaperone